MRAKKIIHLLAILLFGYGFAVHSGYAATYTWNNAAGGNLSWTNDANWSGSAPSPVAGDTIAMNMAMLAATYMDLEADRTFERWDGTYHGFGSTAFFVNSGHTITLSGTTPTIDVNQGTLTLENVLSGTGGMKKEGDGALVLNNAGNDFSGGINFTAGAIQAASDGAFGDPSNDITVSGNVTFSLANNITYARDFVINNGVTLQFTDKQTRTLSGDFSGQGGVYFNPGGFGSMTITLSSTNNTFTGEIKAGRDSTMSLTVNSLADSANPMTLALSNKGDTKFIYGSGAVEPLTFDSRQVILSGSSDPDEDHIIENANADSNNTITINTDFSVTRTSSRKLVLQGVNTGDNTIAGAIPDGDGSVTSIEKTGTGTWVLSGDNTFSGATDITGGILKLAGSSTLADDANVTINGGKLDLATGVQEKVGGLVLGSTAQADGTYGSTASDADNTDDTYFSGEGILYAGVDVPFVAITNTAPTYKTHNTAGLGGALDAIASEVTVYAYWSTNDYDGQVAWQGGTSVSNMVVGTYSNGTSISMEAPIENLIPETTYYYTLVASNADFHVWASPRATFDTLSAPELPGVTTAGGATNIGVGTASLRAELTNGVSANVYICWGADAGNTVSTSSWENIIFAGLLTDGDIVTNDVSGLLYGVEYDYVVYGTNDAGSGWSSVETFQPAAPSPTSPGGEIAIYREATGTDALTTANFDHDWDTTVRENTDVYALNANGYDIELAAGHYLVQYSARFDDPGNDGNQRSEVQSHLVVNGSDADIGWSQGFTRRQDNDYELITSGGGIIEVASDGDTISLRSFRTDAESDTLQREPDTAGIQLLRLNSDWDYLRLSKSANASISSTTFTDVTYDQQDEQDSDSFSHSGGDITLKTAGHYLVYANTYFQFSSQTTDNRSAYEQQLTLAGSLIEGSKTTVYLRGNADSDSACDGSAAIGTIIETTNANQTLNVEVRKEFSGAEDADILAGRTAVTIVKLPDDGDYIRLDDSGTDAFNPSSGGMGWDTELELDAGGFTHSDSQVGAAVDDDYLFFTALYDDDDGNQRIKWWQQWRVNGTDTKKWGSTGRYSRNNENQANGNYSGIILDLTSGDYVEVISSQLGNGGTMQAVEKGLQGVRIGSIFAPPPSALVTPTGDLNTTATEADLLGTLSGENAVLDVTVYWSTNNNDGSVEWTTDGTASNKVVGTYTNFSGTVTGEVAFLSSSTTYYFTMVASNAYTNSWATTNISFTTLTAATQPAVTNDMGVTNVGIGTASLRGIVTAGTSAEATIVWGDDDPGATTVGTWDHAAAMGIVLEGETFTNDVSGLYYGLQYNYRVYVTNDAGEAWSDVETFTTLAPAVGASSVAITNTTYDNLTDSSADLAGLLDATQSVFTAYAVYSPSNNTSASEWENDDTKTAVLVDTYTNVLNQSLSATAGSLSPLTTYYYTMLASNVVTNIWADGNVAFTTFANQVAPSVDNNGGATAVLDTTATLHGNMSVGGLATAYIVYGLSEPVASEDTNAWDHVVTIGQIGDESFSTNITGLSSETAYSYRCFVTNTAGGAWSATTVGMMQATGIMAFRTATRMQPSRLA